VSIAGFVVDFFSGGSSMTFSEFELDFVDTFVCEVSFEFAVLLQLISGAFGAGTGWHTDIVSGGKVSPGVSSGRNLGLGVICLPPCFCRRLEITKNGGLLFIMWT